MILKAVDFFSSELRTITRVSISLPSSRSSSSRHSLTPGLDRQPEQQDVQLRFLEINVGRFVVLPLEHIEFGAQRRGDSRPQSCVIIYDRDSGFRRCWSDG